MKSILDRFETIFWDFDGVIKDSLQVKSLAFEKLFQPYGQEIARLVKTHHESNCGMSRYKKIPLYLSWAGEAVSEKLVEHLCEVFSESVKQAVIDSPWVPGVQEYLMNHCKEKYFILLTATPQHEIDEILRALEIKECFQDVFGAPIEKSEAIRSILEMKNISGGEALMIGDSEADLFAAKANSVHFLLRKTEQNISLQNEYCVETVENLIYE